MAALLRARRRAQRRGTAARRFASVDVTIEKR